MYVVCAQRHLLETFLLRAQKDGGGGGGGGEGGTLIFSYIRRLGPIVIVQILNFNIFGGFRKIYIFWGMKSFWIILRVITKFDYI